MRRSDRARRALAHLPEVDPGLASLALWCDHRDGPGATETRGDTIWYGAEFTALPLHEQVGLLGHHVLHVALRHSVRMGGVAGRSGEAFDPDLFNLAADALVNDVLQAAGHGLPRPAIGLSDLLGGEAEVSDWDVERLYRHLRTASSKGEGERPAVARDLRTDPAGAGEDPQAETWRERRERAEAIGRQAGRGIGKGRGTLRDFPDAREPWERHLRRLVSRALEEVPRLSHRRGARAWVAMEAEARATGRPAPVFQPAHQRSALRPRIAIGLDSSGSIDADLLRRLAGEITGIVHRSGAEVHLLPFDEAVSDTVRLEPSGLKRQLESLELRRDGGTDFADMLARAETLGAAIAVILTDLGGAFGPAPKLPVLWVTAERVAPPPFGQVLLLAD